MLFRSKSDAEIEEKFRSLTEGVLGSKRVASLLAALWRLDEIDDIGVIPPLLAIA